MARLIKAIETEDLFQNQKSVRQSMQERNQLMNEAIKKLRATIDEHKTK